jgi:hypothetical protein
MKSALAVIVLFLCALLAVSQSAVSPSPAQPQPAASGLEPILNQIQQAAEATNSDLSGLHIERWKTNSTEKAELLKVADSLRRNATRAVPDLISEVRASHGSVSTTFKLYHNLNVLYEYLNSLADSAAALGKSDESSPLVREAGTLDSARQDLSTFIEQAAVSLEDKVRLAATPPPAHTAEPVPKKIVVDDAAPKKTATQRKKKPSPPPAQPPSDPN